jgi:hypothetical protein
MPATQKQFAKSAKLAEKRADCAEKRGALLDKRIEATWKLVEAARKMVIQDRAYFKALGKRLDAAIRKRRQRPRSQAKPLGRHRSG